MELVQTISELKEMHQKLVAEHRAEQETIQRANAQLKQQLVERDATLQELAGGPAESGSQLDELQRDLKELGKQLEQKDALILALRGESSASLALPSSTGDAASYEIELNLFRRQLESDRRALNAEIRQIQARKAELDESVRETVLELSRERATLARERGWLDRLRDEVRLELERVRREGGMRDRLEPFQRLAESERHQMGQNPAPAENKTSSKLTGLLNRLSKSQNRNDEG
jgi:chromosome segregation ATPase